MLLSALSGILLWLSWYPIGLTFLSWFAFIPLFLLSDGLSERNGKYTLWQGMIYSLPAFLLWNGLTTWWIWNSTPPGSIAAIFLNSLFMAIVFGLWHMFRKNKWHPAITAVMFIAFWCSWEFLHLHWDISWPWLNLGNVFAPHTPLIQWYEYTGAFGGTIWVLAANFLFYAFIGYYRKSRKKAWTYLAIFGTWIIIPIGISLIIYYSYTPSDKNPVDAVIVQQNTDPWKEQYAMNNTEHTIRLLEVARPQIDRNTELIICPESAIPHTVSSTLLLENSYPLDEVNYYGFVLLDTFFTMFPKLNIITGLSTFTAFPDKVRPTAREVSPNFFIEMYNSSACINREGVTGIYHKSKLVPGVELMPYPAIFGFLEKLVIDLGGPSGSLGTDSTQHAFTTTIQDHSIKIGAPVCYESIYGELFGRFIKDGAQIMCVITNDSWWKETPGHRQHFIYSKLRAVETRRTLMRAANTGISAFIDEKGDVLQQTKYNERISLKQKVYPNDKITFYVKYGDYLARIALFISAGLFLAGLFFIIYNKKRKAKRTA